MTPQYLKVCELVKVFHDLLYPYSDFILLPPPELLNNLFPHLI